MRRLLVLLLATLSGAAAAAPERIDLPPTLGMAGSGAQPGVPQSRTLYLTLIANMREAGNAHAALAHLDAFDRQYPRRPEAALLRGDCLLDIKDYARAGAVYRTPRGPEAASAFAGLGRVEAAGGNWPTAAAEFARAVDLAPTSPSFLNDYGFALLRAGKGGDALFRLRQASELAPDDAKIRNNLILALAATGNDADARRMLAAIQAPGERREIEAAMATVRPAAAP